MCGNEVSQVSDPNKSTSDFYNLVQTQVPTGKVHLSTFSLTKKAMPWVPTMLSNLMAWIWEELKS